ncbi:putative FBD domain, leucine-rich repeat domain superfamily, F-box-like domain superfamily [Helianthus annuus]|nr:putative FBD domain, leucine-rich repeat domain superfamily, F-box-like domain superfamily [Helianthus annuus]
MYVHIYGLCMSWLFIPSVYVTINICLLVRTMARQASEFAPEDFISIMPDNVVTNILDRLPLQVAVRTGILSKHWRFKWTMLSQLSIDDEFFKYLILEKGVNNFGEIISKLIFHLNGTITKCFLFLYEMDVEDINRWISILSKKKVIDLAIKNWSKTQVDLSTHLFSCLELKHLKLHKCIFNPPSRFHGFPNLLSLELRMVQFGISDFGEFFTRCPLLEILNVDHSVSKGNIKLVEIAKLKNLKVLSLSLCDLDTQTIISSHNIFELVAFLPKLQELGLDFQDYKLADGALMEFPTAFPRLKALKLSRIDLGNGIMLSCAFEMIRHFPNLQTLDLEITAIQRDADPIPEVDYHHTLGLRSVVFRSFEGSESEVFLINYILACSPFLKEIAIHPRVDLEHTKQMMFARKLLKLPRASPSAEIDFYPF